MNCDDRDVVEGGVAGRHVVAVLVRPGVLPLELGLVHQIFGQARSAAGAPLYEVVTCGLDSGRVPTDGDFAVLVETGAEVLATADTVVVPASHRSDETAAVLPDELAAALASVAPGARIASIGAVRKIVCER
jgi:transcriptional regulator GlxA family with amidase domain